MFDALFEFLIVQFPIAGNILMALGTLVVVLSAIDTVVTDEKENGFMKKVLELPFIGNLLKELRRFSILRKAKEEESEDDK